MRGFPGISYCGCCILGLCLARVCSGAELGLVSPPQNSTACENVRILPNGQDRCLYVKEHCAQDSFIPYLTIFYCHAQPAGFISEAGFQIFCAFLLVLVFRLLGSTAEDFFSPILTQISQDMGLPPRFAGVTLLALGNGAPDLVASIAFIKAGKYEVAISGLFGGGMFVGAVVAGYVIMVAQGVKARGALLRDVSWYLLSVAVVAAIYRYGRMTWASAITLLVMYIVFVAVVLAADIAHIWTSRDSGAAIHEKAPEQRPLLAGDIAHPPEADLPHTQIALENAPSIELTEGQTSNMGSDAPERASWCHSHSGGRESSWSAEGTHLTYNEKLHMSGRTYRQMALAEIAHSNTFFGSSDMEHARRAALAQERDEHGHVEEGYAPPARIEEAPSSEEHQGTSSRDVERSEQVGEVAVDKQSRVQQWCVEGHEYERRQGAESVSGSGRPPGGEGGSLRSTTEWNQGLPFSLLNKLWGRVCVCFRGLDFVFNVVEYPLLLLRKVTIPLIDTDSYNRKWLVSTAVGAPLAFLWYWGWMTWLPTAVVLSVSVAGALAVAYFTVDDKPPEWSCGLPFPLGVAAVATVGFVVAAMWIDTIAGELVSLLDYFGTLSGIPHTVLGLTVLAWGNSVGDLSTNSAMARRGLSNMAMTACFAGPIFNLLMALSLGFMRFFATHGSGSAVVSLQAVDVPAVALIFANGLLLMAVGTVHKAWVPGWYGAVPLVLYVVYLAVSLTVAFG